MTRLRRVLRVGMAAQLLAGLALVSPLRSAWGQTAGTPGKEAFTHLASCIGDSKRLLVLFLIDESGSLRETDPGAQRVAAARVALSGLESLAEASEVDIEVQLAGFSVDYTPVGGWVSLTGATLGDLQRSVGTFTSRDKGLDTDYFVALQGANRQLAEREAKLSGDAPCKAVLWFTDGKYDIEDRTTPARQRQGVTKEYAPEIRLDRKGGGAALLAEGRRRLCESNPLVDELRQADVSLFAIALSTQIAPPDIAFLRAITNGRDGGTSCGRRGTGETGATLDASEIDALIAAFDRATNEIGGGVQDPGVDDTPVCPRNPCPQGRRTFDVDDTLQRFHLLAATGGEGIVVFLDGPVGGSSLRLEPNQPGQGKIGDVPLKWSWATPTAVTVDAQYPSSGKGWDGKWTVTFVDPAGRPGARARSQIYLFGDVVPRLLDPQQFEAGRSNQLRVGAVSEADEQKARRIAAGELEVTVVDPASERETKLPTSALGLGGFYTADYAVDDEVKASEVLVKMVLTVRTRSGLALAPASRSVSVPILIAGLPSISLLRNRLPAIENTGATEATVVVKGDPTSAGCVWFVGTAAEAPASAGEVTAEPSPAARERSSCLRVDKGETRRLSVKIDAAGTANGKVDGQLRFQVVSDAKPQPVERTLAYEFPITRPISTAKRLGVFLALLIPGILLPLLIAYGANWWSAKFQPIGAVSSGLIPVRVTSGRVERVDDDGNPAGPLALKPEDFDNPVAPSPTRQRRFSHRGYDFRVPLPKSPFAAPAGEGTRGDLLIGGSALRSPTRRDGRAGRLGLALPGEWLLSTDPRRGQGGVGQSSPMQLLIFAGTALGSDDLRRLADSVHEKAPAVAETLGSHAAETKANGEPKADETTLDDDWPSDAPEGPRVPPQTGGTEEEEPPW